MSMKDSTHFEFYIGGDTDEDQANFTIYQEPSQAQKEIDDNNPPGPWPWWITFDDSAHVREVQLQGPFQHRVDAMNAALNWVFSRR